MYINSSGLIQLIYISILRLKLCDLFVISPSLLVRLTELPSVYFKKIMHQNILDAFKCERLNSLDNDI